MPQDNGTVYVNSLNHAIVARMARIVSWQTATRTVMVAGSQELPRITRDYSPPPNIDLPNELPYKYIVVGMIVKPGTGVRYETDTLLTEADIDRMTHQENLRVIFDRKPWPW
jgi:hypothetical protein